MKKMAICMVLTVLLPALLAGCGHTHEWVDANCETPKTCSSCSETEGTALGHTKGEWEIVREASFTEPGLKQVCCSVCGTKLEEETFEKSICENGLFDFSRQEYINLLDGVLKEYSDDFGVNDSGSYIYAYSSNVDVLVYFIKDNETLTTKLNDPLNADSLMVVFANNGNREMYITAVIESVCFELDATTIEKAIEQIQNDKKVTIGQISFITGTADGYDVLYISAEA